MQTILENEVEGDISRRAGAVGLIVYAGRVGGCMKGECDGGVGGRESRI